MCFSGMHASHTRIPTGMIASLHMHAHSYHQHNMQFAINHSELVFPRKKASPKISLIFIESYGNLWADF